MTTRTDILSEASRLTDGNRDAEYGDPKINLACAGELKEVMRKWALKSKRTMSDAEREAIDMVLTKIGRVITGKPGRDTYTDGACYFAIAGECAEAHVEDMAVLERKLEAKTAGERPEYGRFIDKLNGDPNDAGLLKPDTPLPPGMTRPKMPTRA
jgi:hypothetical protein